MEKFSAKNLITRLGHYNKQKKSQAGALQKPKENQRPSLKQGWGTAKTKGKPTPQPQTRLGHCNNQRKTIAPASNEAGALQKPREKTAPQTQTRLGIIKTTRETMLQYTPGLKHCKNQQNNQRPSLKQGWGIANTKKTWLQATPGLNHCKKPSKNKLVRQTPTIPNRHSRLTYD